MRGERAMLQKLDDRIQALRAELNEAEIARAVLAKMLAAEGGGDTPIDGSLSITQAIAKALQRLGKARTREIIEYLAEHYEKEVKAATIRSILSGNALFENAAGLWRFARRPVR